MKGSEKQIKWAEDIISQAYDQIECFEHMLHTTAEQVGSMAEAESIRGYTMANVATIKAELDYTFGMIDSASVIINNRKNFSGDALRRLRDREAKSGEVSAAQARR